MPQEIQAIRFDVQDIGKHVKASKKRFSWTFGLNGRHHTIILDFSFVSSKVKLVVDRKTMLETQIPTSASFQHPFTLDGYALNILQQGQTFQLRINNKVFTHLYNQMKTNTQFKNYEDQVKDIRVDESNFQNTTKTVKLNIGALDGGKKKQKQAVQSQNWGNFGGNQMGIPSYFGDSPTKQQKKQVTKNKNLFDEFTQDSSSSQVSQKYQQPKKTKKVQQVDFFSDMNSQPQVQAPQKPVQQQNLVDMFNQPQKTQNEQFNTMQNMFSTMNISSQPVSTPTPEVKKQGSGLELLTSLSGNTPNTATTPAQMDFNTMQRMFATTNPQNVGMNQGLSVSTSPNVATLGTNQGLSLGGDFNTMQNLFATGVQNPGQMPYGNPSANLYSIQNMYSTGTQNQGITLNQQPTLATNPLIAPQVSPLDNFNTMQNLFATNAQIKPPQVFGTVTQPGLNLQNLNIQDFSTMQNLFKTGSVNFTPPPPPPTTTITTTTTTITTNTKPEDAFGLLDLTQKSQNQNQTATSPSAAMFNTYSGPKSNSSGQIDMSAFGTMQKGTAPLNPIDFLNMNAQKPQEQPVPNFSKKKQPVEDLI